MNISKAFLFFLLINPMFVWAEKNVLENKDWLESLEKRAFLEFISECALRKDQFLSITTDGVVFEFYGKIGVAPNWNGFPTSLTEQEQRWVSACVLSRVNYFGTPVAFNLRTKETSSFKMPISAKEMQEYPFFEGGFFGNIFTNPQKKYVCQGSASKKLLVKKNRVCSFASLEDMGKLSACGFVMVGNCEDPIIFMRDDKIYTEVIYTWLNDDDE